MENSRANAGDHHGHHVQFYQDDWFLCEVIAEFIAGGLRRGEPLLIVVTEAHRDAISTLLKGHGFSAKQYAASGQLTWLDARETLSTFMSGTTPDPVRFKSSVGPAIERCRSGREHLELRVFGEMVDLLFRDGNPDGAIRVEELWNEIGQTYGFHLLCAYAVGNFYSESHWRYFQKVCEEHGHVVPDTDASLPQRLAEILHRR